MKRIACCVAASLIFATTAGATQAPLARGGHAITVRPLIGFGSVPAKTRKAHAPEGDVGISSSTPAREWTGITPPSPRPSS